MRAVRSRHARQRQGARPASAGRRTGTTFTRGLMWAGIAVVMFVIATAFDYRWLKTLAWRVRAQTESAVAVTKTRAEARGNKLCFNIRALYDSPGFPP